MQRKLVLKNEFPKCNHDVNDIIPQPESFVTILLLLLGFLSVMIKYYETLSHLDIL